MAPPSSPPPLPRRSQLLGRKRQSSSDDENVMPPIPPPVALPLPPPTPAFPRREISTTTTTYSQVYETLNHLEALVEEFVCEYDIHNGNGYELVAEEIRDMMQPLATYLVRQFEFGDNL